MKICGVVLGALVAAGTLGCGRRERVALPNMAVPVRCATEIVLIGCDAQVSPPKCKSARVRYRKGCEEIVAGK
jgi:hypothetical protein